MRESTEEAMRAEYGGEYEPADYREQYEDEYWAWVEQFENDELEMKYAEALYESGQS